MDRPHVCSLGCVLVSSLCSIANKLDATFKIQSLAMLSEKSHHSKTLCQSAKLLQHTMCEYTSVEEISAYIVRGGVASLQTQVVVLYCFFRIIVAFELHSYPILGS